MKTFLSKCLIAASCILLLPFMLIIALLIKLSSTGSVLYQQTRVGKYGKTFVMYKFRTMPIDAEKDTGPIWAIDADPRPYPFGNILRTTGLDELPQIINILRGDVSLIGPRPERPFFVHQFNQHYPYYAHRHLVKPGIIGWAQIHGWRGNTSLKKRLEYDLYYVYHQSWTLDLRILTLLSSRGLQTQHV